jgi:hypothetical protein
MLAPVSNSTDSATLIGDAVKDSTFSRAGFHRETFPPGATIAVMAKFKPAKPKRKTETVPQGALPCVILVILGIAGVMLLLFLVMKSTSSN